MFEYFLMKKNYVFIFLKQSNNPLLKSNYKHGINVQNLIFNNLIIIQKFIHLKLLKLIIKKFLKFVLIVLLHYQKNYYENLLDQIKLNKFYLIMQIVFNRKLLN